MVPSVLIVDDEKHTREGLQHLPNPALRSRAAAVLARFAPPKRATVLDRYQAALPLTGDAPRGEALFARNCQTCQPLSNRDIPRWS